MPIHYFIAPDDAGFLTSNKVFPPPEDWEEVTAEEYGQRYAAQRLVADQAAAAWWNDQQSPEPKTGDH